MPARKLSPEQIRRRIDAKTLPFKTTGDVPELKGTIGHDRAIRAIRFGLANKMKGFNIFLLGDPGSGKTSILRRILEERAKGEPTPPDWIYVHNFEDDNSPMAHQLPAGQGAQFTKDMASFVEDLKRIIPKLQEGDRYQQLGQVIEDRFRKREFSALNKLRRIGKKNELSVEMVSGELVIQVMRDGQVLDQDEFEELSAESRKKYENRVRGIQDEIGDFLRAQRKLEREKQEKIKQLEHEQILKTTEDLVQDLKTKYDRVPGLGGWLDQVWKHIPEAFREYQRSQEEAEQIALQPYDGPVTHQQPEFHQFRVNLFVNNKCCKGAPIVFENSPSLRNLNGCIEYQEQYGILYTDYTLIRAGAMHRANGGYLVIQVNDLLKNPFAWDTLKKSLRNKEIRIEELDQDPRMRMTVSPKPAPIPLQTKVILIGSLEAYYFLLNYDEDFTRLFKVKAEFDDVLPTTTANIRKFAGFIRKLVREDGLLPFDASAIARIVEESMRGAEHQKKLSVRFIHFISLVSESNFWAIQSQSRQVGASHVRKAVRERNFRTGKLEYEMYEQIGEGSILLATKGEVVGQINGIAVYDMGDHAFGIPSRITARTYVGRSGILNIDREVRLSGQIHNKASLILVGLIGGLYAQKKPLSLSASICFEQMYGGIDGDSASIAELYALLSSLSGLPIRQGICVTGSLNQRGEVQPIGGVNEKIEGVYRIFKEKGLTGDQGVVIPAQNAVNLMLDEEVVEAVRKGRFHVYSVRRMDDGLPILFGQKASEVHRLVRRRLKQLNTALED